MLFKLFGLFVALVHEMHQTIITNRINKSLALPNKYIDEKVWVNLLKLCVGHFKCSFDIQTYVRIETDHWKFSVLTINYIFLVDYCAKLNKGDVIEGDVLSGPTPNEGVQIKVGALRFFMLIVCHLLTIVQVILVHINNIIA